MESEIKMEEMKVFGCKHCGNLIEVKDQGQGLLICSGEPMEQVLSNTNEDIIENQDGNDDAVCCAEFSEGCIEMQEEEK